MTRDIGHFVGGERIAGRSGRAANVFDPNTGEVQARVALASRAEVEAAIADAEAAQVQWAAQNPQKRARVMFRFLELIAQETDELARLLSSEHGKTVADSRGDIQRGVEVVEFACGIPHLLKGEFSEGAGPGIDMYSMRQPLGVVAGITPFNFPAMIPLWKAAPAIACGNAFILKPSERDPSVPMRIAELFLEAGLPAGVFNVVNGDKEAVDALLTDPDIKAVGFVGSSNIAQYVYATGAAAGKRVQCFGGAKNHMIVMPDADLDQAADALIGAGYGSAGERCMAISVAVPVGEKTADALIDKPRPAHREPQGRLSTDPEADFGPLVTARRIWSASRTISTSASRKAPKLGVDGRGFKLQGYENGFLPRRLPVRPRHARDAIYQEEIFGPVLSVVRAHDYEEALELPTEHEYGNGVAIFTRDGDAARDFASRVEVGMVGINVPIPVPLAYHTFGGWKRSGFGDLNQHGPTRSASTPAPRRSPRAGHRASRTAPSSSSRPCADAIRTHGPVERPAGILPALPPAGATCRLFAISSRMRQLMMNHPSRLLALTALVACLPVLAACSSAAQRWQGGPAMSPGPRTSAAPTPRVSSQQLPPPGAPGAVQAGELPGQAQQQMAAVPAPSGPPTRESVLGQWQLAGPGNSCQANIALTSWEGGYRASTRGCSSPELTSVGAWNIEGNLVVLKDNEGNPVARLTRTAPTRFDGRLELGGGVSMSR